MAKAAGKVTKIYDLKTLGYADISKQLDGVAKKFETIKKAKLSAQGKLALTNDIVEIKRYSDEIEKAILEEQKLRVETQRLTNEQKANNLARQAAIEAQKKAKAANIGEAGSIAETRKQIKDLTAALILKNQSGNGLVNFNGNLLTLDQATAKLKQLTAAEQAFRRQFALDKTLVGEYTTGIVQAFKQMGLGDLVGGQITKAKDSINSLNSDFDRLQKELKETQAAGKSTQTIEAQMVENRKEVIALDTTVKNLSRDLRGVGDVGNQITSSIKKGFSDIKGQATAFAVQFIGITALISKAQESIADAKLLSDQSTDLEIQLGGTATEADRLNASLKKFDTRTTLAGLQKIADVALKAGATKEEITGITKAIDIMKVSFGNDFGSIEQGTETIAKLINIFFEDGVITGDRILKIGNSIRSLANETVASVPFLTDFSGRMAGLKQIANVSLPDILGLGAGFEEFKQSAEVASTVLVKVIPKLASDTAKFASIVGISQQEFSKLLQDNPAEALIRVSEALVKSGKGIEDVSQALADSELGSGRITTIIATLGGKADIFRQRIARAGETIEDTGAITEAFNKKNNNLAASMDKLSKKFSDAASNKSFQATLSAIVALISVLITNLPLVLSLVGLLTVAYLAQNGALLLLRAQVIGYNLALGISYVAITVLRVAQLAYNAVLLLFNGTLRLVTNTMRIFGITTTAASGPLGVILAVVGLLVSAFAAFGKSVSNTVKSMDDQRRSMEAMNNIQRESAKIYTEQIARIDSWITVIKSAATSADTKALAVHELAKENKLFGEVIKDNVIDLTALDIAYKRVTESIIAQANAQASAKLTAEKQSELVKVTVLRQQLEIEASRQAGKAGFNSIFSFSKLNKDEAEILSNLTKKAPSLRIAGDDALVGEEDFHKLIDELKEEETNRADVFKAYLKIKIKADADFKKFIDDGTIDTKANEVDIKALKDSIDALDKEINEFKGSKVDLTKKVAERKKLQDQLDALLGNNKSKGGGRASRLSGDQKDDFKDIDAERDEQLARLNRSLLDQSEFKRKEQQIFKTDAEGKLTIVKESGKVLIDNEEIYLAESLRINKDAIDQKLRLLTGKNAEERKQIADLTLDKIKLEKETNEKIFAIRAEALKAERDAAINKVQRKVSVTLDDATLSDTDRAQAKLDGDVEILALQVKFNKDMDDLEKRLTQNSTKNAQERADAVLDSQAKIGKDQKEILDAQLSDIKNAGEKIILGYDINYAKLRQKILENDKLTAKQRKAALEKLSKLQNFTLLSAELAQLTAEFKNIKEQYDKGLKTEKEYLDAKKKMEDKAADVDGARGGLKSANIALPSGQNTQDFLKDQLSGLFGFEEDSAEEQLLGAVIAGSFDLATQAMNSYFDAERQRIQESLDIQLTRIETEKEQSQARAQSQAEILSLEKQADAKKKKAQQEAGELLKKSKRAEAKISLSTELAGIAASAASNPANGVTFGAAGVVMYGILAGLALARYGLRVSEINREKFAYGGQPKGKPSLFSRATKSIRNFFATGGDIQAGTSDVPSMGGKFGGKPHAQGGTPFAFRGKQFEAEVDELAIVRTKNAPANKMFTVSGTQMQIASAANMIGGGKDFRPGASLKKFDTGGYVGQSLKPPVFAPAGNITNAVTAGSITKEDLQEITDSMKEIATEQSKRIDKIKVLVSQKDITDSQKKAALQSEVGTL